MNTDWYELIEKYNLGHLPAAQAAQFEAAMQADPALAAAVRTQRAEWEMQELLAENLLRAQIRERMAGPPDVPEATDTWRNRLIKYWKYGLPVLLLLGALFFFVFKKSGEQIPAIQQQPEPEMQAPKTEPAPVPENTAPKTSTPVADAKKQPDLRQLAMASYRVPEGISGVRGPADNDTLTLAAQAFTARNYGRTLLLLSELPENDLQEALSLRAHAHFGAKNFAAAARDFSELEAGGIYRREAQWFGLLSRMAIPGADRIALKTDLGNILMIADHPYRNDAAILMKSAF
jgi:hypothetical protein